ncbi:BppU family phage baseplate upper protein [uncultured Weissella sp.]|uniref:BppU family phage baseplate upper protein n=1 Tax=Weissella viridescens TaxID=1629 RepID=UPI0027DDCD6F|nr:BppU family phage baseplate upper protein [uncultured Weissella sp.]
MTTREEANIAQAKEGKFLIVDTTLKSTDTMWFDEISGDYGDAGRKVYLAIKERALSNDPKVPLKPMDLNGMDVRLQGHDANGVFKRVSLSTKMIDAEKGRVEITLPREIYINPGAYENAEFEIYEVNGDTVISTVPIGFEVYNNHAHITTNETKPFSDEFEALKKKLEDTVDNTLVDVNKEIAGLLSSIKQLTNSRDNVDVLIKQWTQLVNDKAVALLNGKNTFTEYTEFLKPISGFITGTVIKVYTSNEPVQDVNDINKLKEQPSSTTTTEYFSNNGTLNNPMESKYFMVETQKVTKDTAFQTITNMNLVDGEIRVRTVQAMTTQPVFGNWYTTSKWSPWRTLVPYLSDKFVVGLTTPEYRFNGRSVEIKGDIRPKETIENTSGGDYILFDKMPFKFAPGQQQVQIGSGNTVFGYFTTGNRIVMQKYMFAGKDAPINKGGYIGIAGTFALD